jgi:hypothetical protein
MDENAEDMISDQGSIPGHWFVGFDINNPNTTAVYLQIYNTEKTNVTVGTTVPYASFAIPAQVGSIPGMRFLELQRPLRCMPRRSDGTAENWSYAVTTGRKTNGAPGSNVEGHLYFI